MEQLEVLRKVVQKLHDLDIEYMLSGSVAMNFYGQPRMTRDIDIVIVIREPQIRKFVDAFKEEFYIDTEMLSNKDYLISPEDLVLNKLLWAREGNSEIQKRDVKNILMITDDIDFNYLRNWSKRLSVDSLLEECQS